MDGRTDGQMDNVETVYPPTNTVCGGYKKYLSLNLVLNEESSREVTPVSYGNKTLRAPDTSEIE